MKAFLNASEVAKLLSVDRATISRWIKRGLLKAERPRGARRWRVPLAAYQQLLKHHYESR
jgi:excisionase family DNA binding protein